MNAILTLSEFAYFLKSNFGMKKDLTFYRNLAKTDRIKDSRWLVKVNVWFKVNVWLYEAKQTKLKHNYR